MRRSQLKDIRRVSIYVRVSSREQAQGYSLETQRSDLTAWAESNGWHGAALKPRIHGQWPRSPFSSANLISVVPMTPDGLAEGQLRLIFQRIHDQFRPAGLG
jgi:Resolvase, N terminal domain